MCFQSISIETQHASVKREKSQATQPPHASGHVVLDAPATTSSSGVPPATPTTSASHNRLDSPVHPSPPPSSRRRTSPPTSFEAGETSGSKATLEARSQPQPKPSSQPLSQTIACICEHLIFGGGLSDLSLFPLYPDHDRDTLKVISQRRKISKLVPPIEPWFDELLLLSRLKDLASVDTPLSTGVCMINVSVERWHHEMLSFHMPHGEMTITLDDIVCMLHLLINGRFLDHERIMKDEALDMLVEMLGVTPENAMGEIDKVRGSHTRYNYVARVFEGEVRHDKRLMVMSSRRSTNGIGGAACMVYMYTKLDEGIKWNTKQITDSMSLMTGLIIQHFPRVSGWSLAEGYTEAKSHAWIRKTAAYIPEWVMRQFRFTQTIPQDPTVVAPPTVGLRDMNGFFDDFENHFVPEEARSTVATSDWSYKHSYMLWFFQVSHPYMIYDVPGNPPRPVHHEILEEKQVRTDHATNMLPTCRRIMELAWDGIDTGLFPDGSNVRGVLDAIMAEAQDAMFYRRQRRNALRVTGRLIIPHT
ncbi:uncharacterized protein LOC131650927 [Vicia villosa]|uniref:uncharacterized protein LOC131650927 n=1 Tax=Vicia villosa TaxID=3911 RepID=UPI00273CA205|nr:uncharacterized protein LOC131650927 [Vicia villosa]